MHSGMSFKFYATITLRCWRIVCPPSAATANTTLPRRMYYPGFEKQTADPVAMPGSAAIFICFDVL